LGRSVCWCLGPWTGFTPKELVGVPLGQTGIRSNYGITVVAVKTAGGQFSNAAADTELIHDDVILVTGRLKDLERFANLP